MIIQLIGAKCCKYASAIQPSLVKVMACRLVGAKLLPESEPEPITWSYYLNHWTLRNKLHWNFNRNSKSFIQENIFENGVCGMAIILSRPQCVKLVEFENWLHCQISAMTNLSFFTRGQFWPSDIVVACACVCVCVRLSVCVCLCQSFTCSRDNSGPVQARITKFGPKMQKTLLRSIIFCGLIDLDLQGQI